MIRCERVYRLLARWMGRIIPKRAARWLKNPVFIVGCARSGTTILTELLAKHGDIANFSEANRIWDPTGYPWAESDLIRLPNWLDPYCFSKMWRLSFTKKLCHTLRGTFGAYQRLRRKICFINKSPMNTFKILDILEIFPTARFIHIYRDGRAVAHSYAKKEYIKQQDNPGPYRKMNLFYSWENLLDIMARSWAAHIGEVEKRKNDLLQKNINVIYELSYERLCSHPGQELQEIFKFLELAGEKYNMRGLPIIQNQNFKYRMELSGIQISRITGIMHEFLASKGYLPQRVLI